MQVGCSCNNSRLKSGSSDSKIARVLEKEFGYPMDREERLLVALELQKSAFLPVYELVGGNDLLLQLGRSGCTFFWPMFPDTNVLLHFSQDGSYAGFERWEFQDDHRTLQDMEYEWELDAQELVHGSSRRHLVTSYFGDQRAYRKVLRNDIETN